MEAIKAIPILPFKFFNSGITFFLTESDNRIIKRNTMQIANVSTAPLTNKKDIKMIKYDQKLFFFENKKPNPIIEATIGAR